MVIIVCMSGKRKSGKDFTCILLAKLLTDRDINVEIRSLSHPLKDEFAKLNDLDGCELKTSSHYKEIYRRRMVKWGEDQRRIDPHIFCKKTMEKSIKSDVIIISDCRRKSDIIYFQETYSNSVITVRMIAGEKSRTKRGYVFSKGIDDAETECDLDDWPRWDILVLNNDEDVEEQDFPLDAYLYKIVELVIAMKKIKTRR
ncbi:Phosphomevalonate kinase [Strongyloides ratti]|uniref:Phosphomevalonate kinase n=1 Tax=Strongyloides ratti TaxID=34506 RepID=A0A090L0E6_STRRB|nr:Phosphomevalonate kinase [Strongyloides ratti]CEF63156.1 Phosphomevalonate kinase [Strongyloides ratti]